MQLVVLFVISGSGTRLLWLFHFARIFGWFVTILRRVYKYTHVHIKSGSSSWMEKWSFLRVTDLSLSLLASWTRTVSFSLVPPILVASVLLGIALHHLRYHDSSSNTEIYIDWLTNRGVSSCNSGRVMDYIRDLNRPPCANYKTTLLCFRGVWLHTTLKENQQRHKLGA